MAKQLKELNFEFKAETPKNFPAGFLHYVCIMTRDRRYGSLWKKALNGAVKIKVVTPVTGLMKCGGECLSVL